MRQQTAWKRAKEQSLLRPKKKCVRLGSPAHGKHGDIIRKDASGNVIEIIPYAKVLRDKEEKKKNKKLRKIERYRRELLKKQTPEERAVAEKLFPRLKHAKIRCTKQKIIYCACNQYILDFYIHKAKLAIEIDGHHHKTKALQEAKDQLRDTELAQQGIQVLRFTNHEVRTDLATVIARIERALSVRLARATMRKRNRAQA